MELRFLIMSNYDGLNDKISTVYLTFSANYSTLKIEIHVVISTGLCFILIDLSNKSTLFIYAI